LCTPVAMRCSMFKGWFIRFDSFTQGPTTLRGFDTSFDERSGTGTGMCTGTRTGFKVLMGTRADSIRFIGTLNLKTCCWLETRLDHCRTGTGTMNETNTRWSGEQCRSWRTTTRRLANFPSPDFCLKLADFGFARHLQTTSLAETLCLSPLYMAYGTRNSAAP